jgi:hypothetical protein
LDQRKSYMAMVKKKRGEESTAALEKLVMAEWKRSA